MEEYYIYKVNNEFLVYAYKYPKAIHKMARRNHDLFSKGQHQLVFLDHQEIDSILKDFFKERNDYTYYLGTHYIRNRITGASSLMKVYDHGIYLRCSTKFHIMKNIILHCDSNYVILDK